MLRFNEANGSFILYTHDTDIAEAAGLTLSTQIRGPEGEKVYFTANHNREPEFNPYAALDFYDQADDIAKQHLKQLRDDYVKSWAEEGALDVPAPEGKEYMPYQKAGIAYALERGNCIIGDEMGLGKLQDKNTLVSTPNGWRKIGELKLGDFVTTVDGSFTRVTGIFPQGMKRSFRVTFRDGTSTHCGAEHLWAVASPLRRKRARLKDTSEYVVKTTRELMEGGLTGTRGKGNSGRVCAKWYIPIVEPVKYPEAHLVIDPYILGVLVGDGYLEQSGVSFSNPDVDSDIRKRVRHLLPEGYELRENRSGSCPRYGIIQKAKFNVFHRTLDILGLTVKSRNKFIPNEYKFASVNQRLDLLRGLMDTDGSCTKNRTIFHTISTQLAEDVAELVRSLGGIAIVRGYDRSPEGKPYEYQVNVKTMFCPFYTERKRKNWSIPTRNQIPVKYIRSIEDTGVDVESVCIKVDHPSHLYVTNDYIVTHNTVQALGVANAIDARRVLILCPASIRLNWRREIHDWSTLRKVTSYPILKGSDVVHPTANYTICSYDLTRNQGIHSALSSMEWDLIVCDEGHYLKTPEAQRTRAMFGGGERGSFFYENGLDRCAKRIIALTGTPLPNRPREAYTLARGLDWQSIDFLSQDAFMYRFNPSVQTTIVDKNTGRDKIIKNEAKGRLPELNARLRCNLMVRRLKKDVLPQLPEKRYEMTYIEPDGAIKEVLAKEALIDFDPHDLFSADFKLDGTPISTLRREMGEAMVLRVADYMKYMLDIVETPKIILYAHHTSVIMALAEMLDHYGVAIHRGGMNDARKDEAKHQFIHGQARIFLGQLDTMEGVDGLQSASCDVVFAEPAWNPGRNEQCVDRAHRYGQHDSVLAHFLLAEGSFNEKVLNVVLDKAEDIHESLDRRIVH